MHNLMGMPEASYPGGSNHGTCAMAGIRVTDARKPCRSRSDLLAFDSVVAAARSPSPLITPPPSPLAPFFHVFYTHSMLSSRTLHFVSTQILYIAHI
jgi:hypothetical protein